jgi:hypothetical protein
VTPAANTEAKKENPAARASTTITSTHRDCARRGIAGLHRRKNK